MGNSAKPVTSLGSRHLKGEKGGGGGVTTSLKNQGLSGPDNSTL